MTDFERGIQLAEGKTKIIWDLPDTEEVLIESKDDITAGDGARRDHIDGKAALATQTTSNCFRLLTRNGIPNHFIGEVDATTFRAQAVDMIPVELVARRLAFGSYLKRETSAVSGSRFEAPVIEFFDKDDSLHDPLLRLDLDRGVVQRHDASKPVGEALIDESPIAAMSRLAIEQWDELNELTRWTFEVLESAWAEQDVTLVDMKIECGITPRGDVVVADVIDNDSWRIWPGGDPNQMVDKQLYRDGQQPLSYVADKYAWVAEATNAFTQ